MKDRIDEGLWAWKQAENHNRMIALQEDSAVPTGRGSVQLAYYGGSAFKITAPSGLSIMIDPWRNPPWGNWDWYLYDFPRTAVDIGISTHAHFDHDGLHALTANVLLDRLIGTYEFADVKITGIADKHVSDSSHNVYDWAEKTRLLTNMKTNPPDNCRSFDNCIIIVEVAGLRILHWGDNRPDLSEKLWECIGEIDIALMPIDGSQHVLAFPVAEAITRRMKARIIVPHHYYIWNVTTRGSTLLPPDVWVNSQPNFEWVGAGSVTLDYERVKSSMGKVLCFGNHVDFAIPAIGRSKSGA